jgi:hypothetical protein
MTKPPALGGIGRALEDVGDVVRDEMPIKEGFSDLVKELQYQLDS